MLPSNLNFNIGKTLGYDNKILISNANLKMGSGKEINKTEIYHQKSPEIPPESCRSHGAVYLIKSSDEPIKRHITEKCFAENHFNETSQLTFDRGGWVVCLSSMVDFNVCGLA